MPAFRRPHAEEVEQLLLNGELRNDLEPYMDESIRSVDLSKVPTPVENKFLSSMLAWEQAPLLPIYRWFEPALSLQHPDTIDDDTLHETLWCTIQKLFDRRIVLDFTDHLSDRELYLMIWRDILPAREKMIDHLDNYLHWDCSCDDDTWLRYYASEHERMSWSGDLGQPLPPPAVPPHPRELPHRPL